MVCQKEIVNIAYCFLIAIGYVVLIKVMGTILRRFEFSTEILSLMAEILSALIVIIIMLCAHKKNMLRGSIKEFLKGLLAGGFLCGYIMIMLMSFFITDFSANNLLPPIHILMFTLSIILTGFSEEILFRGVILNIIYDCLGKKSKFEIYRAITLSSLIFALMHMSNIFSGVPFSAALIQTICAFSAGCYFSAIYTRSGSIWSTIILHSMMNFVSLMNAGLLGNGDIVDSISDYTPIKFVSLFLYLGLTIFLLRDSKMEYSK